MEKSRNTAPPPSIYERDHIYCIHSRNTIHLEVEIRRWKFYVIATVKVIYLCYKSCNIECNIESQAGTRL